MAELRALKKEIRKNADPKRAKTLQWFFKTGKGEYGEGDVFLGLTAPESKEVAKKYYNFLNLKDIERLLHSKIHTERDIALRMLVYKFEKGDQKDRKKVFNLYLRNTKHINNWDLVDLSADKIIGAYLETKPKQILLKLAKSKNLWERRISIIATYQFIKNNYLNQTLGISKILLNDEHDLIHKAVGWMLREVGKKDLKTEEKFLKLYYKKMPRTMLRYAIERFPEKKRQAYLKGKI
jgi:3-methyladenine DNA glycosylase AlkD